jgi:hypothetical protein
MSTYFEFSEPTSQDITSQDSSQRKPIDISEDNEYYEDEVEDSTILEKGDEEEVNLLFLGFHTYILLIKKHN